MLDIRLALNLLTVADTAQLANGDPQYNSCNAPQAVLIPNKYDDGHRSRY